jgi:hypothetical protein
LQAPIRISNIGPQANQLRFTINGTSGQVIVVEATPSLVNPSWTPVTTNTLNGPASAFADPQWSAQPIRFYRLLLQ